MIRGYRGLIVSGPVSRSATAFISACVARVFDVRSGKTGVTIFPRPSARTPPDPHPTGFCFGGALDMPTVRVRGNHPTRPDPPLSNDGPGLAITQVAGRVMAKRTTTPPTVGAGGTGGRGTCHDAHGQGVRHGQLTR